MIGYLDKKRFKLAKKESLKMKKKIYNNFLLEVDETCKEVNQYLGWELPKNASGAIWSYPDRDKKGKLHIIVDVETSDGGVSGIDYEKFMKYALKYGKVSKENFTECFW